MTAETKTCQNCHRDFRIEPDDFDFYVKMQVPPPTFCPECRMIRRLSFRNDRRLFRVKSANDGAEIFSMYPPEAGLKIYDNEYWWSDAWNAMDYARDYDFTKSFFEQFRALLWDVPWDARSVLRIVNSDYSNSVSDVKNCYLCFNGDRAEDCAYCIDFSDTKNSFDSIQVDHLELCYELFSCSECYQAFWCVETNNSYNVWFCKNCDNCFDCFGCINLRNKSYQIFNQPYTKEEYRKKLDEMNLHTYSGLVRAQKAAYAFWKKFPVKYMRSVFNVNADGEFIYDSKNVHHSYHIGGAQNVKYSFNAFIKVADCYDYCTWGNGAEMLYECLICGEGVKNLKFCYECWPSSQNLEYCVHCRNCSDCFGCVGLKKKQYCIFNKQYTKDVYGALKEKIIKHMSEMPYVSGTRNKEPGTRNLVYRYGEFFPTEFSPFSFNETNTGDYFPFSKEEVVAKGLTWRERKAREFEMTITADELPDLIKDVQDSIVKEIIECAKCGRAYRIIPMEYSFYKRVNMPLPRYCDVCRMQERVNTFRPPMRWYERQCVCDYEIYRNFNNHNHHPTGRCPNTFLTTYVPGNSDIVYCEQCYNPEIV